MYKLKDFILEEAELPKTKEPRYGSQLRRRANRRDTLKRRANLRES